MLVLVLKLIGKVLLAILILVLFLLVLLSVPVKYRAEGTVIGKDVETCGRVRWLFGFVRADVSFTSEEKLNVFVKVLWKTVFEKSSSKEPVSGNASFAKEVKPLSCMAEEPEPLLVDAAVPEPANITGNKKTETGKKKRIPERFHERTVRLREKIRAFYRRILEKKAEAAAKKEKSEALRKKITELVKKEENKTTVMFLLKKIKRIFIYILPKKGKAEVFFGTGDPAGTAKILEVLSVLYPVYKKHIEITPDFLEKRTEAEGKLGGRICILFLALIAVRVYLHRNTRRLYKEVKEIFDEKEY